MPRDVCYYDGRCGLCRRSQRILRALDWLGRLKFVDQTQVDPRALPVEADMALQGLPMRTRTGRVLVGFEAVRRALLQTPLGVLPALLLYLPGLNRLGARAYAWIALNRGRDAVCEMDQASGVEGAGRPADTAV